MQASENCGGDCCNGQKIKPLATTVAAEANDENLKS
jgi:hypothetical protein